MIFEYLTKPYICILSTTRDMRSNVILYESGIKKYAYKSYLYSVPFDEQCRMERDGIEVGGYGRDGGVMGAPGGCMDISGNPDRKTWDTSTRPT